MAETEAFDIAPRWQIVGRGGSPRPGAVALRLTPGPGFGDGRHPTTQLCLQALAALAPKDRAWRLLDFGSGSAILSIAGARLGAQACAVEIEAEALAHGARNVAENGAEGSVRQVSTLEDARALYDVVVANILRGVLVSFAEPLARRLAAGGVLVLSGLVSTDVPEVSAAYERWLGARPEVYARDEWRALVWKKRES
jgi:ribosomal protein L11 methyltransferase